MSNSPGTRQTAGTLESVLTTGELSARPSRPPDFETENVALLSLAKHMADSPETVLQRLAEVALEICRAGSAGVSLLSEDGSEFYWPAVAGAWKPHIGAGTPRDFGPCGIVLDRDAVQLFTRPERYFPYLTRVSPPIEEALLTPFHVKGRAVGTAWVIAHDDARKFDAEDMRLMASLGGFAAAAYPVWAALETQKQHSRSILDMNEALLVASVHHNALTEQSRQAEAATRESQKGLEMELEATRRLQEIILELIRDDNVEALCERIVDAAAAIMDSDMASMQVVDEREDALRMLAYRGFDPEFGQTFALIRRDTGTSCSVARREHRRVVVPDVETCDFIAGTPALEDHRKTGIRAVQSTPLISRSGQLLGMISTHWRTPHQPAERELRLLDVLARQTADLIERSQAEAVRARLAAIVESSSDAIISKTLEGIITSWNAGAQRILGYTAEEMTGQPVLRLIPPELRTEEDDILARLRAGEVIKHYETVRVRKDGHRLPVSLTISPIKDSAGRTIGASKILRDVTERIQAENALRESEERFRTLVSIITDVPWTRNAEGEFVTPQPAWAAYTGQTWEELRGLGWLNALHPDDRETVRTHWQQAMEARAPYYSRVRVWRASSQQYRHCEARAAPVLNPDGSVREWVGASTDVDERERFAAALQELNEDLKHFAYAASHDLQEPLRAVMVYTQLLARDYEHRLDPTASQFLGHAVEGAKRMETLLGSLREFWSVSERKIEQLAPVSCNRVLERVLEDLAVPIRESSASVTCDPLPTVIAEELPLTLLFQNLVGNALKYRRPDEPPRIHLSAQPGGSTWTISVADNGLGIEAEYLEAIFAPFKRLHGREYPGTGLGLAMCHKIVERYQGRIWVESTVGQGSTFYFTLPAKRDQP